jgi:RNA polymerase sigma factor (TIGR02999 family)
VTQILQSWNRADDQESQNQLTPILYDTMRRLARKYIVQENSGYTLQATELVHEAYVRLIDSEIDWQNRQHFYAVAAKVMRRILVDRAREKKAQKRGQDYQRVTFIESDMPGIKQDENILELDEVISQLEQQDERKALIIQLYYFAGLTYQEIALCLELSEATIDRELRFSKAWLASHMEN